MGTNISKACGCDLITCIIYMFEVFSFEDLAIENEFNEPITKGVFISVEMKKEKNWIVLSHF